MDARAPWVTTVLLVAGTAPAAAQGIVIDHEAVGCMVADAFPKLSACFAPTAGLARARVYFRPEGAAGWYYVDMKADEACWAGVLPRPGRKLVRKKIEYYVYGEDERFASRRTAEHAAIVVARASECGKDVRVAPTSATGPAAAFPAVPLPAVPAGFAGGGTQIGAGTVALAVAGAGAAAAGVVAATGGDDTTTTTTPSQSGTTIPTLPTPPTTTTLPPSGTHPPVAVLKTHPDPPEGVSPLTVTFDFCASTDAGGGPLSFFYEFGDGETASGGCRLDHTYTAGAFRVSGTDASYEFKACVVDTEGASSCRSRTITVTAPASTKPDTFKVSTSVAKAGVGSGTVRDTAGQISCGTRCTGTYAVGTTVTLLAIPASGSAFLGWSGACAGTEPFCLLTVTADTAVTATFGAFTLTVKAIRLGTGTGTITSDPAGIACTAPATCVATFPAGTNVTLSRTTSALIWIWGDDCYLSPGAYCSLTMSTDHTASMTFWDAFRAPGANEPAALAWVSDLEVPGASGQLYVGGIAATAPHGTSAPALRGRTGENRVEAVLSKAAGQPGAWRFRFEGEPRFVPGSLRVLAGDVVLVTDTTVEFRMRGVAGERVVFTLSVR